MMSWLFSLAEENATLRSSSAELQSRKVRIYISDHVEFLEVLFPGFIFYWFCHLNYKPGFLITPSWLKMTEEQQFLSKSLINDFTAQYVIVAKQLNQ